MLQLKNIVKKYETGDIEVTALKGISLDFRKNEFVSILGQSGCGKTTMLNIIGGLDQYTSGDLVINGVSTKDYKDADWDIYRNNSIGFVFQNYNLIPHQTVLSNVELALTLAGISKEERRVRATEALEKVGLGDQLHKKPLQMSGGQMQRVAIARALVNNPEILLADEPTGALDTETSIQIMELLKEVAQDRLVIMVTHNPDLAKRYSTRIIQLLDGEVISDNNPFASPQEATAPPKKRKKVSMSFVTALSLSFKNLLTKKTRTLLTSFAGSIGIIGIALILSLSSGMNAYITNLERDTLSSYPIEIENQAMDMTSMIASMMAVQNAGVEDPDEHTIYSSNIMTNMLTSLSTQISNNDLKNFKDYIESTDGAAFYDVTNSIQYSYDVMPQVYRNDLEDGAYQVNPTDIFTSLTSTMTGGSGGATQMMNTDIWEELIDNDEILQSQYDLVAGSWPTNYNEVILVLTEDNEISDYALYSLGILDPDELDALQEKLANGEEISDDSSEIHEFSYDELLATNFKLVLNADYFVEENGAWVDKSDDADHLSAILANAEDIKISGIIRPNPEATASIISGNIGYLSDLTDHIINETNERDIVKKQVADKNTNVLTGLPFNTDDYANTLTMEQVNQYLETLPASEQAQIQAMFATMSEDQIIALMADQLANSAEAETYDSVAKKLGIVDVDSPSSIKLYPKDFDSKAELETLIKDYNKMQEDRGHDEYVITYTDLVSLMTSSMSTIIDVISYVLIAFVAISLVVSAIMIAIITYISVLERTKEIGILRSIGASKNDISRVFNAETIIEGLIAGVMGVLITVLLNFPINSVIKSLVGISSLSALPIAGGIGLIILSVLLTVIAGFIPAKMAAKKDPVEALRSE